MLQQTILHFLWRQPLARHLQHVIGASAIREVAVVIATEHVVGYVPVPAKRLFGLFHLLPVADRPRIASHPQPSDFPVWQLFSVIIAHTHVEPGNGGAHSSRPDLSRAIRYEDVPHLGCPKAVQQLDAELFPPPTVQLHRQCLARRRCQPQTRHRRPIGRRMAYHMVDHRWHVDQDRRLELRDLLE